MLIGLLIAALVAMSASSGPGNFFLVPDIKKEIKKSVEDPDRKAELLTITSNMSKEIKAIQKYNKPYLKQIPVVNKDRGAKRAEIERLFDESYNERSHKIDCELMGLKKPKSQSLPTRLEFLNRNKLIENDFEVLNKLSRKDIDSKILTFLDQKFKEESFEAE